MSFMSLRWLNPVLSAASHETSRLPRERRGAKGPASERGRRTQVGARSAFGALGALGASGATVARNGAAPTGALALGAVGARDALLSGDFSRERRGAKGPPQASGDAEHEAQECECEVVARRARRSRASRDH